MAKTDEWVKRWGYEMKSAPVRPGVYRLRDNRWLLRASLSVDGKRREKMRVLGAEASLPEAMVAQGDLERALATATPTVTPPLQPLFATYANELHARKKVRGTIKSVAGDDKWEAILKHHLVPAFGRLRLDELRRSHVQAWLDQQAELVQTGKAKPSTVNTRLALLKTILRAACSDHSLPPLVDGIEGLSEAEYPTYTDEEPNSLSVDEVRRFLDVCATAYPQHYAMVLLGFVTGQRPSHLQPIRRRGPEPDVLWNEGILLIRRSHTRGPEAMNTTKTDRRQRIALPVEVMDVLRWHVATQIRTDAQHASDLLFPSDVGTMRYTSVLHPVFVDVARAMGLKKTVSPRAMRRTFQDLMRHAGVHDIVARSLSGHTTAAMQAHYSTVAAVEQRAAGAKVVSLVGRSLPTRPGSSHTSSTTEASAEGPARPQSQVGT
jgi:integrase